MENSVMVNNVYDNHNFERRSGRLEFSPCGDCGRKFTARAMEVHKRTCLENENCTCAVCRSYSKIKKFKGLCEKSEVSSQTHFLERRLEPNNNITSATENLLAGNPIMLESNHKFVTFKRIEKNVQNTLNKIKPTDCVDTSTFSKNPQAILNDHEYVLAQMESPENSDVSTENSSSDTEKFSSSVNSKPNAFDEELVLDHDCDRKLYCRYCNSHVYWGSFGVHVIEHCEKIGKNLKCPECDRSFTRLALYLTHYFIHNSDHSLFCIHCQCAYSGCNYTKRATDPSFADKYPHHCYICLSYFGYPQSLMTHMTKHSEEMPFKCTVCNHPFRQIGNLQRHMTIHRGDRPYKCSDCSSSFADPATLRNHERVHTGETPYICPCCARGFSQIGNLKRHMAVHLQKEMSSEGNSDKNSLPIMKPSNDNIILNVSNVYPENIQSDGATNNSLEASSNLKISNGTKRKNGRRSNGKLKVFACHVCKKVYTWKHDLTVHLRTHTGEKPYKCEICEKTFAQSGAVNIHNKRHHAGLQLVKKKSFRSVHIDVAL